MIDSVQQHITTLEKRVGADARSPLFAQLAHYYLEAQRAQEALRICDAGLANFPFYTTGHLMKGKALAALHMQAEARREFEFVLNFLPNNETIIQLLSQMPPTAEETLTHAPPKEAPRKIISPEPPPKTEFTSPIAAPPEILSSQEPAFNFGEFEQESPVQQPGPAPMVAPPQNFFEELTQAPSTPTESTMGFGLDTTSVEEPDTFKTSPFSEFNFPQPELLTNSGQSAAPFESLGGFEFTPPASDMNVSMASPPMEEESFENFVSRRTEELPGENTVSLEDYLSSKMPASSQEFINAPDLPQEYSQAPEAPQEFTLPNTGTLQPEAQDKIEELTNKLQSAGKITPVINFAQKDTSTASEQDTPAGMGFVTPTLAEIYAKQGWFDDAIKAYKTLARNKPAEKERFEKRITELEELKKKAG
jgi:tetratricopeptide (TPR) repeat protein